MAIKTNNDPVNLALPLNAAFRRTLLCGTFAGANYTLLSHPGQGKTALLAFEARKLVAEFGGVFVGPDASDTLVVNRLYDPATGKYGEPLFELAGDPRAPVVISGVVPYAVKYVFVPGLMSGDVQGLPVPVRPNDLGRLEFDPDMRMLRPVSPGKEKIAVYDAVSPDLAIFTRPVIFDGLPVESPTGKVAKTLMMIDEFLKVPEMFPAWAGLVHNHRIGQHVLPGRVIGFIGSGNFKASGAGAHEMTSDLKDRMVTVGCHADRAEHLAWLRGQSDMAPEIVGFAASDDAESMVYKCPMTSPAAYCSPRGLTDVSRSINAWWDDDRVSFNPGNPLQAMIIRNRMGDEAGGKFLEFAALGQTVPSIAEILENPSETSLPDRASAMLYLTEVLAAKADGDTIGKVATYVGRLPSLASAAFTMAVLARHNAAEASRAQQLREGRTPDALTLQRCAVAQSIIAARMKSKAWDRLVSEGTAAKTRMLQGV